MLRVLNFKIMKTLSERLAALHERFAKAVNVHIKGAITTAARGMES